MRTTFTKFLMFGSLFLFSTVILKAQLNYQVGGFSTFASTYTDLGTTGSAITMNHADTGYCAPQPIGFTFNFNGAAYDSFVMYVDGFIKLGSSTVSSVGNMLFSTFAQPPASGPFNSTAGVQDTALIFAFGQDLWPCFGGAGAASYRVSTTGSAGTRVCTIQWRNLSDKLQNSVTSQYDTINFQVKLFEGTNAIEIVYGRWAPTTNSSNARFAACGLKGGAPGTTAQLLTLTKASSTVWSAIAPNPQTSGSPLGNYTTNALNYGNNVSVSRPAPDIGRTYHFNPVVYNDLAVRTVYAMGKVALPFYSEDSIRANILNTGLNAQTNVTVSMTMSGANTYSTTTNIAYLAPNASVNVSFAPFTPANYGTNLISVSVPSDDNTTNNLATYGVSTSRKFMSYTDTTQGVAQSYGGTAANFWANRFRMNGTGLVTEVKSFVAGNSNALGDTVCGMVTDMTGKILGRSPNYIIQSTDLGTYLRFTISVPPVISNSYFLAGIAGGIAVNSATYFLGTVQNEIPTRVKDTTSYQVVGTSVSNASVGSVYGNPIIFSTPALNYRLMMECSVDTLPAIDAGITAVAPSNLINIPVNTPVPLRATIKAFGWQTLSSGIGVRYRVNNGTVVGPVNSANSLLQGDTTSVVFGGSSSLSFSSTGTYTVKIFTSLTGDPYVWNDTFTIVYNVVSATPVPYRIATGMLSNGWTSSGNANGLFSQSTGSITRPNAGSSNLVLTVNNNSVVSGSAQIFSPVLNFAGISSPVMHFYVAHSPHTTTPHDDSLQVWVSGDWGNTYTNVYTKSSQNSSPTLGTVAASGSSSSAPYVPAGVGDWRHETIDLSPFANQSGIIISFRAVSTNGANIYLCDFVVDSSNLHYTQGVSSTGTYSSSNASVSFSSSVGATTGSLSITRYTGIPYSSASVVYATNNSATTNNNAVFTPSNVSPNGWWTITYSGIGTGNLPSGIPYYVSFNTSGFAGISQPDYLYIMKRVDHTGSWIALPTGRSGSVLSSGPLYGFCDFAIGSQPTYNALPVKWLSFTAEVLNESVLLKWATSGEVNSDYFEIERLDLTGEFKNIGSVKASGNSSQVMYYQFADDEILNTLPQPCYRLKQVDRDGRSDYSETICLNKESKDDIRIQPNPFQNFVTLFNEATTPAEVEITDMNGTLVYTGTLQTGYATLDLSQLEASAIYFVSVKNISGIHHYKVLKSK